MIRKILVTTLVGALYTGSACATQVFSLEGFGAISRAMGGTGAAFDIGTAGMVTNPATLGLSEEDGTYLMIGTDIIATHIKGRNSTTGQVAPSNNHSNNRGPYFAPQMAFSHKKGSLTYGFGLFAYGGVGTEFGRMSFMSETENGNPSELPISSRLLVLRMPFSGSYRVNDKLVLGASADIVWTSLNLELLMPAGQVGALASGGNLSGSLVPTLAEIVGTTGGAHFSFTRDQIVGGGVDSVGLGGRLGFTYQMGDRLIVGGAYNLETNVGDLEGNATLTALDGNGFAAALEGRLKLHDFEMPASLRLGLSDQLNDRWQVAFDYQRVYWASVMKNIDVGFEAGSGGEIDILLPHDYSDINVYALGAAYQYNPALTLRAGYSYSDNPVPDENLLAVIPAHLTTHASLGLSYKLGGKGVIDFAYSHAFKHEVSSDGYLSAGPAQNFSHAQDNLVLSYQYQF